MAATRSNRDHDVLIRIDERTASLVTVLEKLVMKFDDHTKEDLRQFESLKKWRSYLTGAISVLGSLGISGSAYSVFIK